jgi:hypothetical protein
MLDYYPILSKFIAQNFKYINGENFFFLINELNNFQKRDIYLEYMYFYILEFAMNNAKSVI